MSQNSDNRSQKKPGSGPARVSLREITDCIGMQSDEVTAYLNMHSGKVVPVSYESIAAAERGEEECPLTGESLDEVRAIMADDGYLALPDRREIDEYQLMVRFASSVDNRDISDLLHAALQRNRPFRRFKDVVHGTGLAESWYEFRGIEYAKAAADWCEHHGIPFER